MIGLILAGGRSTRVPYKMFLCQRDNKNPIIQSSVDLLINVGIKKIVAATTHEICLLLRQWCLAIDEYQIDEHQGLVTVINRCLEKDDTIIVCGDNLYGSVTTRTAERVLDEERFGCFVSSVVDAKELDGWNGGWVGREFFSTSRLVSPWIIPRGVVDNASNILTLLTIKGMQPVHCDDPEWFDLGTMESLRGYYRC